MQNILLTGAGFSRNWGGWLASEIFEYLLGCSEVRQSATLRDHLWHHQRQHSGFESALGSLQATARLRPSQQDINDLHGLERAISSAFEHMNERLWAQPFEWTAEPARPMQAFLARFDAIFTLNQDLLLDCRYEPRNEISATGKRWAGLQLPGMVALPQINALRPNECPPNAYIALPQTDFQEQDGFQPLYKLHGSFGWSTANQDRMLIMGSTKALDIENFEILTWYHSRFRHLLSQPETQVMVIGYSFGDQHINDVITDAVLQHGLRFFVVDPTGYGLAPSATQQKSLSTTQQALADTFEQGLIGASRRTLRDIFTFDSVENAKLDRFFERP